MGSEWGQLDNKKKKKWKKRFFQHLSVPPGYSFHEHCLFSGWTKRLTEMPRAPLDAELNALFNHGVRMRPAWQQKKKKMKKKIFSLYHSSSHLKITRTLPVLWLNKASHRNAKGTIGCRIECSIQPWGQNEASLTTKKKKNEKKDFFSIYQYHPVTVSTNIACFLVEPSVSQKCQGHHWMQNWMLYSTMGSEWGQLDNKKKKKWKKRFLQHLSVLPGYSFHEHCLFSGWTKRLTEMPRASLDAELNALFNHGVRMRPAWPQKKKKMKKKIFTAFISITRLQFPRTLPVFWLNQASHRNAKGIIGCRIECSIQPWGQNEASLTTKNKTEKKIFSAFISTTRSQFPRTLPVFWLNQASHRNAKGTIGCRIECTIQPWGQNEASLTTKKKKNEKKDFFSIYQYHPVTVSTNIACFLVEPSVSQKCQGHHWMQNWMLYSTMGSEWGQLDNKKKKKWKKRFFQHLSVPPGYSFHEHCLFSGWTKRLTEMPRAPLDAELNALFNHGVRMRPAGQQKKKKMKKKIFSLYHSSSHLKISHEHCLFCGWTKRLTEMPRAPLDAELNALFNHGVRMRPAWQQKKKKMKKKIFSAFITTTRLQFPRTLPVFWLNQASHRNAKGIIGCRIECSIQPWGQNEASWTTKKKKNEKKDFFVISQQ